MNVFDSRAKEDKEAVNNEKAFEQYFTRVEPLGKDRNGSIYWKFPGCDDKLFVQLQELLPQQPLVITLDSTISASNGTITESSSSSFSSSTTTAETAATETKQLIANQWFEESLALKNLYNVRHTRYNSVWKSYDSLNTMWVFCEHLDVTVEAEKNLKAAVMARYEIVQPDMVFLTEGSEYIGRSVARTFGKKVSFSTLINRVLKYPFLKIILLIFSSITNSFYLDIYIYVFSLSDSSRYNCWLSAPRR